MSWDHRKIRRTFLDYFVKHPGLEHREVSSSPIIPPDDPTLLFTNAGMNQFKALLLGQEKRDYTRACSVQKVMRVGGKHNDLDAVGKDGRHLTWFEMLGNWSFGDYYKRETIRMAWDLVKNVYQLDLDRVYASVYSFDEESYELWRDDIGLSEDRIYRFGNVDEGDDENFWSMGPIGPCGPCTELFYDLGPEAGDGPDDVMGGEGDRYMEFWNNVFMEFNRSADGVMTPLAMQSVDTGMGMERITTILQGKTTVYDTDLFTPMLERIQSLSGHSIRHDERRVDMQVIADHMRSLTFVLSEGGQFANEGRGYVLRRILRRAVRHGRRLGFEQPFLHRLVPTVGELFDGIYDLPTEVLESTAESLEQEEFRFFRTIDRGMSRITSIVKNAATDQKVVSGKQAFELYDTFGFPVDLTAIEAAEHGFSVDTDGFHALMEAQRARSRSAAKFYSHDDSGWSVLQQSGGQVFAGYGLQESESRVVRYLVEDDRVELVLEQTPFYAEGGGELADRGQIEGPGFTVEVNDVQKVNGIIHHHGRVVKGTLVIDQDTRVISRVDEGRRQMKRQHHTATHLLHAALKNVLGDQVQQKGSVVDTNRLRFDFSHNQPLNREELDQVERWVNQEIWANHALKISDSVALEEAKQAGVTALFGEKYGDRVRTVRVGPNSFELCGGNHVSSTGEMGTFLIMSESGVAAGVRRIEALVGQSAYDYLTESRHLLRASAAQLKTEPARLVERIEALQSANKELKKSVERAERSGGASNIDSILSRAVDVGGIQFIAAEVQATHRGMLANLMDGAKDRAPDAAILFLSPLDGKTAVIGGVGANLKKTGRVHMGRFVGQVCEALDGRGGGRPDFAQGGGQLRDNLNEILSKVSTWFDQHLQSR